MEARARMGGAAVPWRLGVRVSASGVGGCGGRAWSSCGSGAAAGAHGDWASGYLHLASVDAGVEHGARVGPGQRLGPLGADPLDPERIVHLHLQLAPGGVAVDPAPYLDKAV